MLVHCLNLQELEISNIAKCKTEDFVKYVQGCKQLIMLNIESCKNFSEQQLTEMLSNMPQLVSVNATNTEPIRFCNFLLIICSLNNLRAINMEPKFPKLEMKDWCRVFSTFEIHFGHSIASNIPFYGQNMKCNL